MEKVKLQEFLNRKGLTQQQLADCIGVKRELVAAWNTGRSEITRENLAKLFEAGMFFDEAMPGVKFSAVSGENATQDSSYRGSF